MAIKLIEGFDSLADGITSTSKGWTSPAGSAVFVAGRTGGQAYRSISNLNRFEKSIGSNLSTIIYGFAFARETTLVGTGYNMCADMLDGATSQVKLMYHYQNGTFAFYRGGTLLWEDNLACLTASQYYYIELKVVFSATVGSVELRINNAVRGGASTLNTIQSANAYCNKIQIGANHGAGSGSPTLYDDLYVCDTTGSFNNNYLGDSRVDTVRPSAAGASTDFTPSTGVTNWDLVDETIPTTTDYNSATTVGARDLYEMTNLPALTSSVVHAVSVTAYTTLDTSGAKSIELTCRSGTTNSDKSGAPDLPTTLTARTGYFDTDPNTSGAWNQTSANAMQAGVRVAT